MLQLALVIWKSVPPVARKTNPNLAGLVGLAFGGIGLGLYFLSVVDFLVPVAITLVFTVLVDDVGFWGGVILAGFYGFMRSVESNARLLRADR